jgi:hypothetical protein
MPTERESIRLLLRAKPDFARMLADMIEQGRLGCSDDVDPSEPITICAGPDHGGVIGAVRRSCGGCGLLVWLSPSTLEMLEKRGSAPYEIRCHECAMKLAEAAKKV